MYTVGLDKKSYLILYSQNGSITDKSEIEISEVTNSHEKGTIGDMNRIKEIIFGSVLGDGQLELPPRGVNARFGFTQACPGGATPSRGKPLRAEGQKDYFIFVGKSLSAIHSAKYREYEYVDKRTGKTYKSLNF
jgi:hypothetical protein